MPPKFMSWSPTPPKCMYWRKGLAGGNQDAMRLWAPHPDPTGLVSLEDETWVGHVSSPVAPAIPPSLHLSGRAVRRKRHTRPGPSNKPGKELSPETEARLNLDLGLPSLQGSEIINFCSLRPPVCTILLQHLELAETLALKLSLATLPHGSFYSRSLLLIPLDFHCLLISYIHMNEIDDSAGGSS